MEQEQKEPEHSPETEFADHTAAAGHRHSRLNTANVVLLCAIVVFSVLAYGAVETWAFGVVTILTGLIVLFWLADSWIQGEFRYHPSKLQLPLFGLIAIGLIQLLPLRSFEIAADVLATPAVSSLSLNPYATRLGVIQLIYYAVFFAACYVCIDSADRLRRIVAIVIVFASIMAFFGILQRLASPDGIYGWRPTPQAIPFASFVNQHHFAAFMEMTIGLTFALLIGNAVEKDKRPLLLIALVLMGIAVLLTGSRGGLLSLLGVVGFVLLTSYLRSETEEAEGLEKRENRVGFRRKLAFAGTGLALIAVLAGAVLFLGGDASLSRSFGFTGQEDISSGRLHFWWVAWEIFKDYPILGAGFDAFGTTYPRYDTLNGNFRVEQAHNEYLQTLADTGIVGLVCVGAFIFLLFKKGFQRIGGEHSHFRRSVSIGALAGCFGIIIHSFFDFPLRTPSNSYHFLLLAVLATVPVHFSKRHRKTTNR